MARSEAALTTGSGEDVPGDSGWPTTLPPGPITNTTRTLTLAPPSTSQLGFQRSCTSPCRRPSAEAERPVAAPRAGRAETEVSCRAGPLAAFEVGLPVAFLVLAMEASSEAKKSLSFFLVGVG